VGALGLAPRSASVNRLAPDPDAGRERYLLPPHAHVVVYDGRERELLTVYDCGAAQKPPSAQLLGNLVRVEAAHERRRSPTGYAVSMHEPAALVAQGEAHWTVRPRED